MLLEVRESAKPTVVVDSANLAVLGEESAEPIGSAV